MKKNTWVKSGAVAVSTLTLMGLLAGCGPQGSSGNSTGQPTTSPTNNAANSASGSAASNVATTGSNATGSSANGSNTANGSSSAQSMDLNQAPKPMKVVRSGNNVQIDMYTEETRVEIAPGVTFPAWTFDGTVPGPVIQLQQGDHVTLRLHNLDPNMTHSIDLHAALVAPNVAFTEVQPGKTKTITFDAMLPGVFMYHCETAPMPLHIAQGMYGAVVVTPKGQQPPTYTIVQSEFYKPMDLNGILNSVPNYVVFNGKANQYVTKPLAVKAGQPITVAFVNAGPNLFSAFHVVGTTLRDVQASGNPKNNLYDVQTYTVGPGDGALIHLKFDKPGVYAFVSHSMSSFGKGDLGKFDVK